MFRLLFVPKEYGVLNSVCQTQFLGIDAVGQFPSWKNDSAVVLVFLVCQEEQRELRHCHSHIDRDSLSVLIH